MESVQDDKDDTVTQVDIDAWRFPSAEVSMMSVKEVSMSPAIVLFEAGR